jgi:hypothetical protein
MTPVQGEEHWSLANPADFDTVLKTVPDMETPALFVPIPVRYGGSQPESEEAVLVKEEEGGFTIANSKEQAMKQIQEIESLAQKKAEIAKSPIKEIPQASSGFGDFNSNEMDFMLKIETAEAQRLDALRAKLSEEQTKKVEKKKAGQKQFEDWQQYTTSR